jgi:hypothetical protein
MGPLQPRARQAKLRAQLQRYEEMAAEADKNRMAGSGPGPQRASRPEPAVVADVGQDWG